MARVLAFTLHMAMGLTLGAWHRWRGCAGMGSWSGRWGGGIRSRLLTCAMLCSVCVCAGVGAGGRVRRSADGRARHGVTPHALDRLWVRMATLSMVCTSSDMGRT